MEYRDFTKRLDSTVKEKGNEAEAEHYDWFHHQGIRLKVKYRPRSIPRGGK